MDEMVQVGRKLKLLREVHNYTQEYVANILDISQNTYSLMENGQSRLTIDRLGALANLYNIELADLLSFNEQTVIHQITHSQGICSENVTINNRLAEEERKFFKQTIERLEKANERLFDLIDKLSKKIESN